jgi:hypothetical protein
MAITTMSIATMSIAGQQSAESLRKVFGEAWLRENGSAPGFPGSPGDGCIAMPRQHDYGNLAGQRVALQRLNEGPPAVSRQPQIRHDGAGTVAFGYHCGALYIGGGQGTITRVGESQRIHLERIDIVIHQKDCVGIDASN